MSNKWQCLETGTEFLTVNKEKLVARARNTEIVHIRVWNKDGVEGRQEVVYQGVKISKHKTKQLIEALQRAIK